MAFPETRLRRFRRTPDLRRLVRETRLSPDDLVLPLFVCPGEGVANPISSMPGVFQHSVDRIVETCRDAFAEGIRAVLLFGLPEYKDAEGSAAIVCDVVVMSRCRYLGETPCLVDTHLALDIRRPGTAEVVDTERAARKTSCTSIWTACAAMCGTHCIASCR